MSSNTNIYNKLWLAVLGLLFAATWAISHGYQGLHHDAVLYTLQALAHRDPRDLASDVFLRFGSQDQYSLFSSLTAVAFGWMGVDSAAAILTFTMQLAVVLGGALLLHRVAADRARVALGLLVLLAIPGFYGADRIFSCIEPFLTPRMGAEALVLTSMAAAWSDRPRLAWGLAVAAMLIHPVMAAAGLMALGFFYFGIRWPRLAGLLVVGGLLLVWAGSGFLPTGRWGSFDPEWLMLVRGRSPYVFLGHWTADDWGRTAVPLATLAIGAVVLTQERARVLCQVVLCTALTGLLTTLVACDLSRLVLFTQLQPWRWEWLAVVAAALLLPSIAGAAWKRSNTGKIAIALLSAAWFFGSDEPAVLTSLAAIASLAFDRYSARREFRMALYGAIGVAIIALVSRIASNLLFLDVHYSDQHIPLWIREAASVTSDGSVPVALGVLAMWLATKQRGAVALTILGVLAAATCVALAPDAWRRWSQQRFTPALVAEFAPWRALVPPGAEVFWSESPLETWILLQRPSYISVAQSSGMLFSRVSALELQRRAEKLAAVAPTKAWLDFSGNGAGIGLSPEQAEHACASAEIQFLVTGARLSWQPIAQLSPKAWHSSVGQRLYRCSDRAG